MCAWVSEFPPTTFSLYRFLSFVEIWNLLDGTVADLNDDHSTTKTVPSVLDDLDRPDDGNLDRRGGKRLIHPRNAVASEFIALTVASIVAIASLP